MDRPGGGRLTESAAGARAGPGASARGPDTGRPDRPGHPDDSGRPDPSGHPYATGLLTRCAFPPPGKPVTCAVSGGPDSLALLVLAVLAGCEVTAVHVDHGLRAGSAAEAQVVADAAVRLGARFLALTVWVEPGPNLEARARAARFAAMPPEVATGHTMDDQAETVLANLLRGSGTDGAAGMRAGASHPILGLRRRETRAVCEESGLQWVEDPSNADPHFLRNRVRTELLPLCERLAGRDPVPLLARFAAISAAEVQLLERMAREAVPDPAAVADLVRAPEALAARALRRWLRGLGVTPATGGRPSPGGVDRQPPSSADVGRVLAVARGEAVATEIAGGWRVRRARGRLVVQLPAGSTPAGSPPADDTPAGTTPSAEARAAPPQGAGPVQSGPMTTQQPAADSTVASSSAPRDAGSHAGTPAGSPADVPAWAQPGVGPVLVSAEQIAAKVEELGARITRDFADEPPLLVGVLKGAMMFMSDLCRAIALPVDVDFMAVSSYGSATQSSGVVRIVKDLDAELTGRRVLVVEDIIDSGLTLNYLRRYLRARSPKSVDICALLVKEGEQRVDLDLRYVGFVIPPEFVVGYGLDVAERLRNLPGVHTYLDSAG